MISIRIPATTANIGPGFDTFGMALSYYNYLYVSPAGKLALDIREEGADTLPLDKTNLVVRAAQAVYDRVGAGEASLAFTMVNNIPLSRGLGSSSAGIVGGMMAANAVLGFPLAKEELLYLAAGMEGHPDNVAPVLLGGFVASCNEGGRIYTAKFNPPQELKAVVAIPEFKISTQKSRHDLPRSVTLSDAVYNISHASVLALSLAKGDWDTFSQMLKDKVHQQYRFDHIKGAGEVAGAAINAGALGCVLSGSGPSMVAFTLGEEKLVAEAMKEAFRKNGVDSRAIILTVDTEGANIFSDNEFLEE